MSWHLAGNLPEYPLSLKILLSEIIIYIMDLNKQYPAVQKALDLKQKVYVIAHCGNIRCNVIGLIYKEQSGRLMVDNELTSNTIYFTPENISKVNGNTYPIEIYIS